MFQALKDRFSKDDAAKAERKAEAAAKRRELEIERSREEYERRARMAGKEGGG